MKLTEKLNKLLENLQGLIKIGSPSKQEVDNLQNKLADSDINSKIEGSFLRVDKENLKTAKSIVKSLGL